MKNILLFGASGHAKVIIDIVEKENKYQIVGLVDDFAPVGKEVLGYKVIGTVQQLSSVFTEHTIFGGVVAVGDNALRKQMVERIKDMIPEFVFVSVMHASAQVGKNVSIGEGTVLMAGSIVNSQSILGKHCIINTKASVDHDGVLGDYSSLAPAVTLAGTCTVGSMSAVCLGANVIQGISIGKETVIGAGSLVLENIPDSVLCYGVPAVVIRSRNSDEPYMKK